METYFLIHFICWLLVIAFAAFGLGANRCDMNGFYSMILGGVIVAPFMIFIAPFYILGQKFKT